MPRRSQTLTAYRASLAAEHRRQQAWLTTRLAGLTDRPSIWDLAIECGVPWTTMSKMFRHYVGVLPPRARSWNVQIRASKQDGISGWWVGTKVPRDGLWFADRLEALAFKQRWQARKGKSPTSA